MKLAAALRDGLLEARLRCGPMIYRTVEALGYVIVPRVFVDGLMRSLEKGDATAEETPNACVGREEKNDDES